MSDNWRSIRLGEVMTQRRTRVKVKEGSQYPLLGVRWYGAGPFLRETVSSETSKATSLYEVHVGDFIYNRLFAWKGSFGLVGEDLAGCFVSGEFPLFEVDERNLDREFLNFLMCRPIVWEQIEIESTGSTKTSRNRWKEEALTSFRVRLPPIEEQRRIVNLVGSIDTYIDSLETQIEATRTARSALLSELLSNPGDDWQETTLGGIAEVVSERVDPTTLSDAVYVGLEHLETDSRTLSAWGTSSDVSSSTTPFVEGDTLFGRLRPYLRKGCVAPFSGVCTPEILVVRSGASVDSRFLGLLVLNDAVFDECNRLSAGSRMPRTSATDLKGLSVSVPPFTEQRRIVDLVGSFDEQISSLESQVDSVRALRSGVLSELLSGERLLDDSYDVAVGL